ncbi:hypothetical protein SELMODRAFT_407719 [Selaginella moellendorffii]|uniref:Terpene synthase n=1 Tax=Selaginella moellendorffii TaxID=88036 RepID=D8R6J2_SELML|nr:hypothetical protein SELMODRAFT_407719 [Selaginella moellendorffii]
MAPYDFVPNVQCSFPVKCHPLYSFIRPGLEDWAATLEPGHGEGNPKGLGADLGGAKRLVDSYLGIIHAPEPVADMEFPRFCDMWNDLRADMPLKQYQRFANRVSELLKASVNQVRLRNLKTVMGLEELLAHRRMLVGVFVMETLMEYGMGFELQDDAISNQDLQEAESLVADHCNWRYSVQYRPCGNSDSKGFSFEYAADKVQKLVQSIEHRFKKLCENIRRSSCYNGAMEAYLEGLSHIISGNLEWHRQTGRYKLVS